MDAARRFGASASIAVIVVCAARPGRTHTLGLSTADFEVTDAGPVEARLTFASAEPLGKLALDRDHDGVVTLEDVTAARDDLAAFMLQGVEVTADGVPCPGVFRDVALTETDGLVLEATFACPKEATEDAVELEATLYYLSALPRGHREIARIAHGSQSAAGVLTGDRRAIALAVRPVPSAALRNAARGRRARPFAIAALAAGILGLSGACSRRWRAARAAWQNRGQ